MLILTWPKDNLRHSSLNWVAYSLLLYSNKRYQFLEKMLQILHCPSRHHWIVAATVGNKGDAGKVLVYDSIFNNVNKDYLQHLSTATGQ